MFNKKIKFVFFISLFILIFKGFEVEGKNYERRNDNLSDNLIANLSEEYNLRKSIQWKDYNRCVEIYNSAEYLYTGDFTNSRILLRNENGNEVIYKVKIDENRLENSEYNDKVYSFEQKCFKKVDFELWRVVIGQTYRFRGRPGGPEGAIQYKWNDNSKNELITYRKVPYEPIIQEVLVKKCPIKVKQSDLYRLDSNYRYAIEKSRGLRQQYIDFYGGLCMDYEVRGANFENPQKDLIINFEENSQFNCSTSAVRFGKDSKIAKELIQTKYLGKWLDQKGLYNVVLDFYTINGVNHGQGLFPSISVNKIAEQKINTLYKGFESSCKSNS